MPKAKGAGARRSSSSSSSSSSDDEGKRQRGAVKKEKKASKDLPRVPRSELREFRKDALASHNKFRKEHKVDSLKMSDELNKSARRWAKHLAKHDKFENSQRSDIGECVGMHYSSITTDYSGDQVSEHWYSELRKYDFKKPGVEKGTGNFTQMVWKGSKEFGIAKAITSENKVIVVAHYKPPGNYIGEYDKHVFRRTDGYIPPETQKSVTRVVRQEDPDKARRDKETEKAVKQMKGMKLDSPDLSPKDLPKFQKDALKAQNKIRKKHDADPMKQSKELEKRAQEWAAHLAKNNEFKNSGETDIGENVAMHYNSASTDFSGDQAVQMWYKSKEKYNFKKPGFTSGAGQFTQMVWKGSKEFGAGKAVTKEGKVIIVGFYKPPGNMMPEKWYKENVDSSSSSSDSD